MKDLNGSVNGVARQSVSAVYAFLSDVAAYPTWYPAGVKKAQLTGPDTVSALLAVTQGPIQKDFDMEMSITRTPESAIVLRRLPKSPGDQEQLAVTWHLAPAGESATTVTAQFAATLSIPAWLPLGGVEKAIPQGFLSAALASLNRGE